MKRFRVIQGIGLLLLWLFGSIGHAQNSVHRARLTGKVVDEGTGDVLPGVEIFIPDLKTGTSANVRGEFSLILRTGQLCIAVNFLGYTPDTLTVNIWSEQRVTVRLRQTPLELSSVTVTAKRRDDSYLTQSAKSPAIISPTELVAVRGQMLGQTLSDIPGVMLLTTDPSISKPVIRGLHSERVIVLNAGVAQEGQLWGDEHAPERISFIWIAEYSQCVSAPTDLFPIAHLSKHKNLLPISQSSALLPMLMSGAMKQYFSGRIPCLETFFCS